MNRAACLWVFVLLAAGCESPLPMHQWRGPEEALREMSVRSAAVRSASGTAALTLRRPDGAEVRLDSAFAAKPPDALRVRAWKFDRAVADWTLRHDGVWVWQAESEGAEGQPQSSPWTGRHADMWPLLFGIVATRPGDEVVEQSGTSFTLRRRADPVVIEADIDGATQTVRECRIVGKDGAIAQRIRLLRYRALGDVLWPMRVVAEGEGGSFVLDFGEVQLNEEPPENAFTPPARARRLN